MALRLIAGILLAAVALAGCSRDAGNGGQRSVDSAVSGNSPPCSEVWVEGETLPLSYRGCEEEGELQAAYLYQCLDGGALAIYRDRLYARLGDPVIAVEGDMIRDQAYTDFWHACMG